MRFLRPLLADVAVVWKCHLSVHYTHEKGRLFSQLVDLLQSYEGFEIDDHFFTQLSDDDVMLTHYSRLQVFQFFDFKKVPKLRDFACSVHKRADLTKKLLVFSDEELNQLVCQKLKLVWEDDPCSSRRDFLIREDTQEAVAHLLAYVKDEGEMTFRDWSRMAAPFKGFRTKEVKQPNIGEVKPSAVMAEVEFMVSSYRAQVRS